MKGYLYILMSEKLDKYYIGSSNDPIRRLDKQHNKGFVKATKSGIPWKIVFQKEYVDLIMARKIEYKLKTYKSRKIIEKIIKNQKCNIQVGYSSPIIIGRVHGPNPCIPTMIKFILHGGNTSNINVDNDTFFKEFGKELKDNGKILLNYFARDEHEWDRLAKEDEDRISRLNKNKKIQFEIAKEDIFEKQIRSADVIYFRGGDTYKLLETLKKIKKLESLFEGKLIIGSSAGVCVLGKYFYDNDYDKFDEGLGIINFKIFCHYDKSCLGLVKELNDYKEKLEILKIPQYKHKIICKSDNI